MDYERHAHDLLVMVACISAGMICTMARASAASGDRTPATGRTRRRGADMNEIRFSPTVDVVRAFLAGDVEGLPSSRRSALKEKAPSCGGCF
jgi:hypothetical protein